MSDEATGKAGKTWLYVVGILVSLPLLYVLSIGPAAVLNKRKIMSTPVAETVYAPVFWLMEKSANAHSAVEAYCLAWMRLTDTPVF